MSLELRPFGTGCTLFVCIWLTPFAAWAQGAAQYPAKPVRFVVVTAPGGGLEWWGVFWPTVCHAAWDRP